MRQAAELSHQKSIWKWIVASRRNLFEIISYCLSEEWLWEAARGLTAKERRSATKVTAARYQKATKKLKRIILEEFAALTGYDRCYAAYPLRTHGKKAHDGGNTILVTDVGTKERKIKNLQQRLIHVAWDRHKRRLN